VCFLLHVLLGLHSNRVKSYPLFSCQILNSISNPVNGITYTNVQVNDTGMYISLQIMVFQLNQHSFQKNWHGRVVDWWYAVCLPVRSRTIRFHLVEWFSQIFHSLGCQIKNLSSSQDRRSCRATMCVKYIHRADHSDSSSLNLLSHSLTS